MTTLNLRVNGEPHEADANTSLQELVTQLNLTPERIAIEVNQKVVRRADWATTLLKEDDRIEIVHFVGGGAH